ncbi:osteocrin isoform X1 [Xiphophorus couchianus]|uniref:osteocrin isoform X1 n=1 Tax=Xiphophorus couchianus TaxID=32473 RepID=UPI001016365A|nr:osteocrin isoform X1 [Xiphophorus couchianus]
MQLCSHLLIICLLSIILQCNVLGVQQQPAQHIDGAGLRTLAVLWRHPGRMKPRLELSAKLLQTDNLVMMMENDVTEPKRKRSFPGNNAPLDRLSMSSMETRQGKKKQSKVVESPRRRNNLPPIDRVGMSRLPTTRG